MVKNKLSISVDFSSYKKIPEAVLKRELEAIFAKSGFDFNIEGIKILEVKEKK